jgi:hypothetical protein
VIFASLTAAPARALTDLGAFPTSPGAGSVFADGSKVYMAVGLGGIRILDVSNPAAPSLLGQFDTVGVARQVVAQGNRAYIAASDGLHVLDVSNPAAPALLGSLPLANLDAVAVSGSFAYAAKIFDGLVVVDVSNPAAPVARGSVPSGGAHRVAVVGTTVYLVDNQDGVTDYPADTLCPIAYDDDENGGMAPMGCGLLGLEPLVMLAVVRRLRRRGGLAAGPGMA